MKVIWSPLAIERVLESADFIALDKPEAARRWAESIFASTGRLQDYPESGRVVPELGRPEVREIIHAGYRVVYRVEQDQVLILTVRGSNQLLDLGEVETE